MCVGVWVYWAAPDMRVNGLYRRWECDILIAAMHPDWCADGRAIVGKMVPI